MQVKKITLILKSHICLAYDVANKNPIRENKFMDIPICESMGTTWDCSY